MIKSAMKALSRIRERLRLTRRSLLSLLVLIPALIAAVVVLAWCLRGGALSPALVNGRLPGLIAQRFGVAYHIESLRIGCWHHECEAQVDATGVRIALPDADGVEVNLDSVHWCRVHPLSFHGLRLGTREHRDLLAAADVDSDLEAGTTSVRNATLNLDPAMRVQAGAIETAATGASIARDIRVTTASQTTLVVQRAVSSPLAYTPASGRVALEAIEASGIDVDLQSLPAADVCEQTRGLLATGRDLSGTIGQGLTVLDRAIARIRRDLVVLAVAIAVSLGLLKLLATASTRRWSVKLALAGACTTLPVVVDRK